MIRTLCVLTKDIPRQTPGEVTVETVIVRFTNPMTNRATTADEWLSPLRLCGTKLDVTVTSVPHQIPRKVGSLVVVDVDDSKLHASLEDALHMGEPSAISMTGSILPVKEPCVRVPLSILRELRGQEGTMEAARRAIVNLWRRTPEDDK